MAGPAMATSARERKWEIEAAADTLIRAAEIRQDRPLFRAARALLKKKKKAISAAQAGPQPGAAVGC